VVAPAGFAPTQRLSESLVQLIHYGAMVPHLPAL